MGGQKETQEPTGTQQTQKEPSSVKGKNWLSKITARKASAKNPGDELLKKKAGTIVDAWLDHEDGGERQEEESAKVKFTEGAFMHEQCLMRLFTRYNTGIPSSAGVELMFSIGKLIMTDNRSRLSDKNFEALMFMKENMKLV